MTWANLSDHEFQQYRPPRDLEPLKVYKLEEGAIPPPLINWALQAWGQKDIPPLPEGYQIGFKFPDAYRIPTRSILVEGPEINFQLPTGKSLPAVVHFGGLFGTMPTQNGIQLFPPQLHIPLSRVLNGAGVTYIETDGTTRGGPDPTPLGAYTLENARRKMRQTRYVERILREAVSHGFNLRIAVPHIVGILEEAMEVPKDIEDPDKQKLAVLISVEPKDTRPLYGYIREVNPFSEEGARRMAQLYELLGEAVGFLHFVAGVYHTQLHLGNIAIIITDEGPIIYFRDFETSHSIQAKSIRPSLGRNYDNTIDSYAGRVADLEFTGIVAHLILKPLVLAAIEHLSSSNEDIEFQKEQFTEALTLAFEAFARGYTSSGRHLIRPNFTEGFKSIVKNFFEDIKNEVQTKKVQNLITELLRVSRTFITTRDKQNDSSSFQRAKYLLGKLLQELYNHEVIKELSALFSAYHLLILVSSTFKRLKTLESGGGVSLLTKLSESSKKKKTKKTRKPRKPNKNRKRKKTRRRKRKH